MVVKSLKIKNNSYNFWDDTIYLEDFDENLIKIVKRESRVGVDIYYIGCIVKNPQYNIDSVNLLSLVIKHIYARVDKIEGSSDRYLVIDRSNTGLINIFDKLFSFIKDKTDKIIEKKWKNYIW